MRASHSRSPMQALRSAQFLLLALFAVNSGLAAEKAQLQRHTVMADGHPIALWEKMPLALRGHFARARQDVERVAGLRFAGRREKTCR